MVIDNIRWSFTIIDLNNSDWFLHSSKGPADLSSTSYNTTGASSSSVASIRPSPSSESVTSGLVHSPPCFDVDDMSLWKQSKTKEYIYLSGMREAELIINFFFYVKKSRTILLIRLDYYFSVIIHWLSFLDYLLFF